MYCTVLYCTAGRDVHQRVRLLELGGHGGQAPGARLLQQGQAGRLPLTLVPVTSWSKYVIVLYLLLNLETRNLLIPKSFIYLQSFVMMPVHITHEKVKHSHVHKIKKSSTFLVRFGFFDDFTIFSI